jgi:hypothetical protein
MFDPHDLITALAAAGVRYIDLENLPDAPG